MDVGFAEAAGGGELPDARAVAVGVAEGGFEVAGGVGERGAPGAHLLAGVLDGVHAGGESVRSGGRDHVVDCELVAAVRIGGRRSR